jgi:hypothetical protein
MSAGRPDVRPRIRSVCPLLRKSLEKIRTLEKKKALETKRALAKKGGCPGHV